MIFQLAESTQGARSSVYFTGEVTGTVDGKGFFSGCPPPRRGPPDSPMLAMMLCTGRRDGPS